MGSECEHDGQSGNAGHEREIFTELSIETVERCIIDALIAQFHRMDVFLSRLHSYRLEAYGSSFSALSCSCSAPPDPWLTSSAPWSPSSMPTPLKCSTTPTLSVSVSAAFTALRRASLTAPKPSKHCLRSSSGKMSSSIPTARIRTGAPLQTCSCGMAPTSITHWSKTAGAGGIGSMRQGIPCWKAWRRTHEKRRKVCGKIRSRCHRGSGERALVRTRGISLPVDAFCAPCSTTSLIVESGEVDFSRTLTYPSAGSINKYLWIAEHKRTKP